MKNIKWRWILIILAGLAAVICSFYMISVRNIRNAYQDLAEMVDASSKTLRQVLPEFNGKEQLYREVQDEMNTAVLRGFAYQLAHEREFPAEEFERKCGRYGAAGGFVADSGGKILYLAGEDIRAGYEASLTGEESGGLLFYSEKLPDGRTLVLGFSDEEMEWLIGYSVSWMNRVQGIRIGQNGFACVLSQEGKIISHPETRLTLDGKAHFNLKTRLLQYQGISLYNLESSSISDQYYYSMVGSLIPFQDHYILCGVTLPEFVRNEVFEALCFPLLLFLVLYVIIRYLLLLRRVSRKAVLHRLSAAAVLGLAVVFFCSLFLQAVNGTASQMAAVDNHARNAVNVLETELKLIADRNGICLAGKQLDVVEFEAAGIRKQDETDNKDKEAKETSAEQSNAQNAVNSKEEGTT